MATAPSICKKVTHLRTNLFRSYVGKIRKYSAPASDKPPLHKEKYIPGELPYPKGFRAATAHAGVKESNTHFDDLALIASDQPCNATAVFTKNRFKAAPVQFDQEILRERSSKGFRGVIVNSGCANAVTGNQGLEDAKAMGQWADRCLSGGEGPKTDEKGEYKPSGGNLEKPSSLVMSTGVIGQRLPMDRIIPKISDLASSLGSTHSHWLSAARAICTTDTFPKLRSRSFTLPLYGDTIFTMTGMAKGAGMIHPNMATLLGIICTDAPIEPSPLHGFLRHAITRSFNSISIDGDTSTNDTVALLANGAAAPTPDPRGSPSILPNNLAGRAFTHELVALTTELAQLVVRDGEGATKFVTIRMRGRMPSLSKQRSRYIGQLRRIASTVAKSPLVKTALYGRDANWGRILCAIGYSEVHPFKDDRLSVSFLGPREADGQESVADARDPKRDELELLVRGEPQAVDEARAAKMLAEEDLEILIRLDDESDEAKANETEKDDVLFWTCDFSHEYVTINGDYRT